MLKVVTCLVMEFLLNEKLMPTIGNVERKDPCRKKVQVEGKDFVLDPEKNRGVLSNLPYKKLFYNWIKCFYPYLT